MKTVYLDAIPQLGDLVEDIVTLKIGKITGESVYLWGCRQLLVHYKDDKGEDQSSWFDEGRLGVIEQDTLAPVRRFSAEIVQLTDKDLEALPVSQLHAHRGGETPPAPR